MSLAKRMREERQEVRASHCVSYERKGDTLHVTTNEKVQFCLLWRRLEFANYEELAAGERLVLSFDTHKIVVEGQGLHEVFKRIASCDVEFMRTRSRPGIRHDGKPGPFIKKITATAKDELRESR